MAISESIDMRNIVQTEQVIYRNVYTHSIYYYVHYICTYTCMHITTINEKGGHGLKEQGKVFGRACEGRGGKGIVL